MKIKNFKLYTDELCFKYIQNPNNKNKTKLIFNLLKWSKRKDPAEHICLRNSRHWEGSKMIYNRFILHFYFNSFYVDSISAKGALIYLKPEIKDIF